MSDAEKKKADKNKGFTAEERAAMKERAKELKAEEKANKSRADGEKDLMSKIDEMPEPERTMIKRLHKIITETAPNLMPKTWYGMPAYALNDKILCFYQGAKKFETRYGTLGFNDIAQLDDGNMWPVAYALKELSADDEKKIVELVKKAVSKG